jgi:branched-chain amino acid transport system substrate-binding protein
MRLNDWRLWTLLATILVLAGALVLLSKPSQVSPEGGEQDVTTSTLEGTIKIGVLSSTESMKPVYEFLTGLALGDINEYCVESGYNCSFEFLYTCGDEKPWIALEQTQMYKAMGIDLVVGYDWSSHLSVAASYSESNDMVLLSPSSTSPVEHLTEEDNVFRLCPHDFKQAAPMVRMMRSLGVTDAVVIQRGDLWGDGLAKDFKRGFKEEGGRVQAVIRYPVEIVGDGFLPYAKKADAAIRDIIEKQGQDNAAVLLISFYEDGQILERASGHPALMGVQWFGSEYAVDSSGILESSCPRAAAVGLISPIPSTAENNVYESVNQAFVDEFNRSLGYYDANIYDCCWVMALSVLEAGTADGEEVVKVLPEVAAGFTGATGPCILDENGDREGVDYDLWGYFEVDGTCESLRCGTYHHESDSVEWDEALMPPLQG